jgi:hypothetical protein
MKAETWLPLATLALGWAGAQLTELFRDRRISSRERRTRQEASQRATLLDLPRRAAGAVQPDDGDQRRSPPGAALAAHDPRPEDGMVCP